MKTLKYILSLCVVILALTTCSDDEKDLNFISNVEAPSDLAMLFQVTQDNSGLVTIIPTAQGAVGFDIYFGDDTPEPENFSNGQSISHTYAEGTYTVTAVAYGVTGLEATLSQELVVSFEAPSNLVVTIENDAAISKRVHITASADFAVSFDVTSDGITEETPSPVTGNIGETVFLDYLEGGTYTITVEAMGAAIETSVFTEEFEVTAIEAPLTSAPSPPARSADDVISIYSGAYTNISGVDFFPNWNQSTMYNEFDLAGDTMLQYTDINYQGIDFSATPVNASAMEFIHLDIWTADANDAKISPISTGPNETAYDLDITAQEWTSFDIPLSFFTDQNPLVDFSQIIQFKLEGAPSGGAIFVDNLYFYKAPSEPTAIDGTWRVAPEAGSLGVGPTQGATNWWSIDALGVIERSCYFDDTYVFNAGSFSNVLGSETWLEGWQGVEADGCGAAVAPHDGSSPATYIYNEAAGTITISGSGAYLGLPKAHNGGEDGMPANDTITYLVNIVDDNTMIIDIEAGSGVWWTYKLVKDAVVSSPIDGTWVVTPEPGSLGVGPTQGATNWWSIDALGVIERSCYFDDTYVFNAGSFSNVLGSETWLEGWQGVEADGCGAAVAPHDGSSPATYIYNEAAGTITISGSGAYLGLPKAHNGGEDGMPANDTITYLVNIVDDNTMIIDIEAGSGVWWTYSLTKI